MADDNEWGVDEDDLKGGTGAAKPPRSYTVKIEHAEVEKDKNQRPYIKLVLEIIFGSEKGGKLWENYLPLGREKSGKNAGKVNARTASFLKAIGHKQGVPPGAPGGPDISTLVGTIVDVKNENEYQDVPDEEYPVRTWEKRFKEVQASGRLEGIKPRDSLGFYSLSDEFEGIGGGATDDSAADESWG